VSAVWDLGVHELPDRAVVLQVDQSASHEAARTWAADQAALEGRPLVLIGMAPTGPGTAITLPRARELSSSFVATAADVVRRTHPGLDVRSVVRTADSLPALLDLSRRCALLVIGSHPKGVTAVVKSWRADATVANRAECPVVVVPRHHPARARHGVLVGVEVGAHDEVLEFAYRQASIRQVPLTVMTCERHGKNREDCRRGLAEATAGYGQLFPDVHVTLEQRQGRPAHDLVLAATAMNLLVVGRHRPTGISNSLAGHVRTGVVDRSPCPVAVVPFSTS